MIEALIRDDTKLICVVIIQEPVQVIDGPDRDGLNFAIFFPSKKGRSLIEGADSHPTYSGVMAGGGEPAQQVARAIMTVYPVSALPKPASEIVPEHGDCRDREEDESLPEGQPPPVTEKLSQEMFPESWRLVERRMASLDKREANFIEREKKLEQHIENLRKSHPDREKWP